MKTDKELQDDVLAELAWESSVNAAHIGVEVDQGVVTLSGHVDTYAEKWGAERAAKRVKGTRAVAIDLMSNSNQRRNGQIRISPCLLSGPCSGCPPFRKTAFTSRSRMA